MLRSSNFACFLMTIAVLSGCSSSASTPLDAATGIDSSTSLDAGVSIDSRASVDGGVGTDTSLPGSDAGPCELGTLPRLRLEPIVTTDAGSPRRFSSPIFVTQPPNEPDALYVVERGGVIRVVRNGAVSVFLDIGVSALGTPNQITGSDERGLLGLAFHPGWPTDRRFYVAYTPANRAANVVAEYHGMDGDNDRANPTEVRRLIDQTDPFQNHNGGMLAFGPDGFLYVAMGDGGSGGDPNQAALNKMSLLGKILRLDVGNSPSFAAAGNPFSAPELPQIWIYGVRNPWRFSFDRANGDLYIADVGQNEVEEIDIIRAGTSAGVNLGWSAYEGTSVFRAARVAQAANHTPPDFEIPRDSTAFPNSFSITGGYVYRGTEIPALQGVYLFSDIGAEWIGGLRTCGNRISSAAQIPGWENTDALVSFGEDNAGNLYVVYLGGVVGRLRPI